MGHSFSNPRCPWAEALLDLAYRSRLIGMLLYRGMPQEEASGKAWQVSSHPAPWVTPEDYARNLSRMVDLARSQGAQPILLDAPHGPVTAEIRNHKGFVKVAGDKTIEQLVAAHARYQAITARVAAEKKVPFIRTADKIEGSDAYFSRTDIAHPNAARHAVIAQRLYVRMLEPLMRAGGTGTP